MEPTHAHLATRLILLPKDTNAHGTIFGGGHPVPDRPRRSGWKCADIPEKKS